MDKDKIELLKREFGKHLQGIRDKQKMSLLDVSYNCNIDDSKISKIEHGKFNITLATIVELAKGLNVHHKKLLDFDFSAE